MKNQAQGLVQLHTLINTDMDEEAFYQKFHGENIVATKIQFTLSDGSVHNIDLSDLMDVEWITFHNNKEENEQKEKATDDKASDRIAI